MKRMLTVTLILSGAFCSAQAQTPSLDQVLSDLQQVKRMTGVSISPDGHWITWNQELPGTQTGNRLFVASADGGGAPVELAVPGATGNTHDEPVAWSPDSKTFAFFSKPASDGQYQIYVASVTDPQPRQIGDLHGYATDLQWSPDGDQLSFLYAENGGGGGPLKAHAAPLGEIGESFRNQRITVIPAAGGDVRQITPGELNVYEYDWSHDGKRFAAIAAPGPADNNWWIAKLYVAAVSDGQMHTLWQPGRETQIAIPRWSPDDKQIALIGGLMSDEGFVGGDVWLLRATGGAARDVTPGVRFSASALQWKSNDELILTAFLKGGGAIYRMRLPQSKPELLWQGEDTLHIAGNFPNMALSSDASQSAIVRSTWQYAPEVWAGAPGNWTQLTHINASQQPHWGKAESINWTNAPYHVQGWLLYPEHFDPAKRYPMVVSVHGGPSSERSPSWPSTSFDMSVLSQFGYFVFFPNPRGSYGEGEAFTRANVRDFGYGDLKDILTGIDMVEKRVPVDEARLGITGWSYGGYMTMWTVTQTHRFHAAIAGAGIADWLSYYGENSIDQWMTPFFGNSVYNDPSVYARSSPITFIKNVKTPTLVLVGENDAECPSPQSFEFWHALKALDVPTKLVVYAGEGHAFDKPKDNLDRMRRSIEWFDRYLNGNGDQSRTTAF